MPDRALTSYRTCTAAAHLQWAGQAALWTLIALKFNNILTSRALHALVFGELVQYACMPVLVVDGDMSMGRMRCSSMLIVQNLRGARPYPETVSAFAVRSLRGMWTYLTPSVT